MMRGSQQSPALTLRTKPACSMVSCFAVTAVVRGEDKDMETKKKEASVGKKKRGERLNKRETNEKEKYNMQLHEGVKRCCCCCVGVLRIRERWLLHGAATHIHPAAQALQAGLSIWRALLPFFSKNNLKVFKTFCGLLGASL